MIGTVVCRVVIPLWILAGAGFKLAARDPNLLPKPVKDAIIALHGQIGVAPLEEFMSATMRSIIAVEVLLAAAMIFLPKASRLLAIATLGLFIAILGSLVATGQDQCGCFGAGGPSPRWMLAIDSAMFVAAVFFGPSHRGASGTAFGFMTVIGTALAFGVPEKSVSLEANPGHTPAVGDAGDAGTATDGRPADGRDPTGSAAAPEGHGKGAAPPTTGPDGASAPTAPPAAPASAWPPPPEKPRGFYMPDFKTWTGQRLSEQQMMLMLERPLPEGLDTGKWHVILYRVDCDHCQALLNERFTGKLETRTLLVAIPDSAGEPLPNRVTDAVKVKLMRGASGPDYVLTPPVVVTVVDGVIKSVCTDTDDTASLEATLGAS